MRIVRPMLLALVASAVLSYNVHAQATAADSAGAPDDTPVAGQSAGRAG
jgi:hypothetical protein